MKSAMKNPPESKFNDLTLPPGLDKYKVDLKKFSSGFITFSNDSASANPRE